MFKNQLQELAQRSCFNLPSYACVREGPDHAPRFRASVNFNGEIFESPSYCTTLRQAEHAAAEVALNMLSCRGPSKSLTARVLDETGIYKNLLQETAHRVGLKLPVYTTVRSGPGHVPVFSCTVVLAGTNFNGEPAKTKKQAEKNAAIAAWSALKRMPSLDSLTNRKEQDQAIVARVLSNLKPKDDNSSKQQFNNRRKDQQNQARRKLVNGNNSSLEYRDWKLLDLLLDSALDSLNSNKKKTSFVSLLPPPPPRTASKILPPPPPTLNRPSLRSEASFLEESNRKDKEEWPNSRILPHTTLNRPNFSAGVSSKSSLLEESRRKDEEEWPNSKILPHTTLNWPNLSAGVSSKSSLSEESHTKDDEEWLYGGKNHIQKTRKSGYWPNLSAGVSSKSSLLEESHTKDEEEWLYGGEKPDVISTKEGSSSNYRSFALNPNTNSVLDDKDHHHPSIYRSSSSNPYAKSSYINRGFYATGGFNPQRIAPAVQIRSVIPVCAAPPPRPPLASGFSPSTSTTTTTIEAKVSSSSSELSQLGSEFNKLQL